MNLEIFDKHSRPTPPAWGYRALSVNRRNARLTLSTSLIEEANVKAGMSLFVARNTDAKCEWYIRFDNSDNGLLIRHHKGGTRSAGKNYLGVTTRGLSAMMLDSCKAERGMSLLVAKTPTKINGQDWYQLITSKPIRVN